MVSKEMLRMLKWTPKPFRWRIYALMEMYGNYMIGGSVTAYITCMILCSLVVLFYGGIFIYTLIDTLAEATGSSAFLIVNSVILILFVAVLIVGLVFVCGILMQLLSDPRRKALLITIFAIEAGYQCITNLLTDGDLWISWTFFALVAVIQYPKLPKLTEAQKDLYKQIKQKYRSERGEYSSILESFTFKEPPYAYMNVQPVYAPTQQAPYVYNSPYNQPLQQPVQCQSMQQQDGAGYNMSYQQPVSQLTPYQQYQQLTGQPVTQYQQPVVQPNTYQQPCMQQPMLDMPQQPVQQNTFEIPKVDDFEQSNPFSEENFGESKEASDASFASDGSDDLWS